MIPTAKFRWLRCPRDAYWEDVIDAHPSAIKNIDGTYRVLQQWWQSGVPTVVGDPNGDAVEYKGEWRDIPIEAQP